MWGNGPEILKIWGDGTEIDVGKWNRDTCGEMDLRYFSCGEMGRYCRCGEMEQR